MSEYIPIEKLDYTFYKWIHISKDLTELCYVGSTANLSNRKRNHKNCCNNPNHKSHNILLYKTMRENGGFDNFKMVILGTAEQLTKREAEAVEEEYRIKEQSTLNMKRCFRTDEQKKQANIEHSRNYYQDHKAELIKKSTEYNSTHKEQKKQSDKKYHQLNKEKRNEYTKQYLQDNAEILKIQRRIKYLEDKKARKAEQNQ